MIVTRLRLRDFRSYERAEVALGRGLTLVHGRNGAGKTNLVEALYLGCTGRSFRTSSEREAIRFGARVARVELEWEASDGAHAVAIGLQAGEPRHIRLDGRPVERLADEAARPLAAVFHPDRLDLVKGAPAVRRAHLDQVVAALWPARAETRRRYARALAQRNALLGRIRAGQAGSGSLAAWDAELARHGWELMGDRRAAVDELAEGYAQRAADLGLAGAVELAYRPRSRAASAVELAGELAERTQADLDRGFTAHGPHRDDLSLRREGRELRVYGSQGQQRLALLALLLAEREALERHRGAPPLMLLDDVLSELDPERRAALLALLAGSGQSVLTAADARLAATPEGAEVTRLAVSEGAAVAVAADAGGGAAAA